MVENKSIVNDAYILEGKSDNLFQLKDILNYFHFTFVRNPWDRILSCYNSKNNSVKTIGSLWRINQYEGLNSEMSFEEFVEWLSSNEGQDSKSDRHWISQYRLLVGNIGCNLTDYIGKLENLEDGFNDICNVLNIKYLQLPIRHKSN